MEFNRIDWRPRTPAQCEVLKLICTGEGLSRIDIARRLDMPKMTVSNVAAELIRQGLVAEGEARAASGAGRRPIELSVAEGAPLVLGLCVARGACTALLCDLGLKVLQIERAEVRGPSDAFTEGALALLDRFQAALPRVGAIGISSIGPVDTQTGVILNPPDFHGIQEVPIAEIVARRYRKPVCFNNDVKCSALVEHLFGSARGYDDFLELSLSNGVGSGIVVGGRLYQNECGASGEIGHVSIDYAGPLCACGNRGCLECYASIPPMERRLRAVAGRDGDFRDFCRMRGAEAEAAL
ncbi:MAG: ROK family transcriptional regulator, partial [Clostridiales bacterium]|nr:ROK family transcriptional regulator [Clostridiales bacterium]